MASARGMGVSISELALDHDGAVAQIEMAARACLDDGADVLILGCMSMAFLDPTPGLVERLDIPVSTRSSQRSRPPRPLWRIA